jgi:type IV secretion system protein VirB10
MRKIFRLSFVLIAMFAVAGTQPFTETTALAAQKKACNCKPALRKKPVRKSRTARARASAKAPVAKAQVVGPVVATYTLPENQTFTLKMEEQISSRTARVGDRFRTTVVIPVYASGVEVVPAGSTVEGRITAVTSARSRGRRGSLGVAFDTLVLPDGTRRKIDGSLTDVRSEDGGEIDSESHVSGRSSENRQIVYVGGGGVGGAILGGAIGGGKGAAIGAAVGAGAGVAGAMLSKGHEAEVGRGTELNMIINRPVTFTVQSDRQ